MISKKNTGYKRREVFLCRMYRNCLYNRRRYAENSNECAIHITLVTLYSQRLKYFGAGHCQKYVLYEKLWKEIDMYAHRLFCTEFDAE